MKPLYAFLLGSLLAGGAAFFVANRNTPAPTPEPTVIARPEVLPTTPVPTEPLSAPDAPSERPSSRPSSSRPTAAPRTQPVETARTGSPTGSAVTPPVPTPAPAPGIPRQPETATATEPARETILRPNREEAPRPTKLTVPAGTMLNVRVDQTLSSSERAEGDTFVATLTEPLLVDGKLVADRGARATGQVISVDRGGRVKGTASIAVQLTRLTTANGDPVRIETDAFSQMAARSSKKDAAKVGIAAGIGAAIGAIAGGGKGAAIGAGAGGAAGAGGVLATRGDAATIPVETPISFRLNEAITVEESTRPARRRNELR